MPRECREHSGGQGGSRENNMKQGNWVPLDKGLIKTLPKNRSYSYIEAMFSYSVDRDNNRDGSINGYSVLWGWSRNKVRKFINELRTVKGHLADSKGTYKGHPIRFINNNLEAVEDKKRTVKGQLRDSKGDTTIYPNPKPNPKPIKTFTLDSTEYQLSELLFTEILKRNPEHKKPNLQTWSKDIDKMIRLDNRKPEKIKAVAVWCQKDSFWQGNILSTAKLREKYDQLLMKMNGKKGGYQTRSERNAEAKEEFLAQNRTEIDITPEEE